MKAPDFIWSNTDFPYMCLRDEFRTKRFREAINKIVKKGDAVVDVGSGTGIMSLFAADAGAKKVYAVEIDHLLTQTLKKTIDVNHKNDVIEVIEGDILNVDLPKNVDVIISEIIETGMLDELQVPAMNALRNKHVIGKKTRILPAQYITHVQLVHCDSKYYGYKIFAPRHEWPFYKDANAGWLKSHYSVSSDIIEINRLDFEAGLVEKFINKNIDVKLFAPANAIKISGIMTLCEGMSLGSTNALNGDKILCLDEMNTSHMRLNIQYEMGKGLGSLIVTKLS